MTRGKPLSKDIIAKIRKGMLEDKSKCQIAKELNISRGGGGQSIIGQEIFQVDPVVGQESEVEH